jgi:hypothetical protein
MGSKTDFDTRLRNVRYTRHSSLTCETVSAPSPKIAAKATRPTAITATLRGKYLLFNEAEVSWLLMTLNTAREDAQNFKPPSPGGNPDS